MYVSQPQTRSLRVTVLSATGGATTPAAAANVTFTANGGVQAAVVTNSVGVALLAGAPSGAGVVAVTAPCPASMSTTFATSVEAAATAWVCGDVVSATNARTEAIATGDTHVYACSVSVASQIDVPCHTTATLTASFMQGAQNATAAREWQVLTPNVLTVTAAPGTPHAPAVNVSGEHHGSTVIRLWAGGVFGTTLAVVPAGCP